MPRAKRKIRSIGRKGRVIDLKGFSFKYKKERQSLVCLSVYLLVFYGCGGGGGGGGGVVGCPPVSPPGVSEGSESYAETEEK